MSWKPYVNLLLILIVLSSILGGWDMIKFLQCYNYTGEAKACKVMVLNGGSFIFK